MYDPGIHKRKSIRLKGFDYSSNGAYFVTICTEGRLDLFGEIKEGVMELNIAGRMIEKWWYKLPDKFPSCVLDSFVIMPNHVHGILGISKCLNVSVGADPRVGPQNTLSDFVQWFKTMTTNEYIKLVKSGDVGEFEKRVWQRNFYERIIKNEKSFEIAQGYVANNPVNWDLGYFKQKEVAFFLEQRRGSFVFYLSFWGRHVGLLFFICLFGADTWVFCFLSVFLGQTRGSFVFYLSFWGRHVGLLFFICLLGQTRGSAPTVSRKNNF